MAHPVNVNITQSISSCTFDQAAKVALLLAVPEATGRASASWLKLATRWHGNATNYSSNISLIRPILLLGGALLRYLN